MISDEERERLHTRLDALINNRLTLQRYISENQSNRALHPLRRTMLREGIMLLKSAISEECYHPAYGKLDNKRKLFGASDALKLISGLLPNNSPWCDVFYTISTELKMLTVGETSEILIPAKRAKGVHPKWFTVTLRRAKALQWDVYLERKGVSTFERRAAIQTAFRAQWDTIRKWRGPVESVMGSDWPQIAHDDLYEYAFGVFEAYHEQLQADGDAYWSVYKSDNDDFGNANE